MTTSTTTTVSLSVEDVRAHLNLLKAFHDLRAQIPESEWAFHVAKSVAKFRVWAASMGESGDSEKNVPDLDVLMVWHTYMLNPVKYRHDSTKLYPRLSTLGAFPLRQATGPSALVTSREVGSIEFVQLTPSNASLRDLEAAVLRQAAFISKVVALGWTGAEKATSLPSRAVNRYEQFLQLMSQAGRASLVPTLDIDLAWHTHQLKGEVYCQETKRVLGYVLNHDDNIPEPKLAQSFETTAGAWESRFGLPYLTKVDPTALVLTSAISCGAGGCDGSCGARELGSCSGGCSGECGAKRSAACSADCSGECAAEAGCQSGACSGECGAQVMPVPELVA